VVARDALISEVECPRLLHGAEVHPRLSVTSSSKASRDPRCVGRVKTRRRFAAPRVFFAERTLEDFSGATREKRPRGRSTFRPA
jgi:hypothetical protein